MAILTSKGLVSREDFYRKPKKTKRSRKKAIKQPKQKKIENNPVRDYTLYILNLEGGKYYVGITITGNIDKRVKTHSIGKGAKWTTLHKPMDILHEEPLGVMTLSKATILETEKTIELIDIYGLPNVRGGGICQLNEGTAYRELTKYRERSQNRAGIREAQRNYADKLALQELSWLI